MYKQSDELKTRLVEMVSWFHDFCQCNNLRYYALGGTMLGAVRHSGFIPWDDDIDIGMPRADYERLEELLAGKKNGKYVLETPNTEAEDFYYPFTKLYDTTTTLIENTRCRIKRGIYLDIFPLDGIGNTEQESRNNYELVNRKRNFLLTRTGGIRKGRSLYKNLAVIAARFIPGINNKKLLADVVKECRKYDYDSCEWCGNLVGAWGFKEIMPRSIMGKPTPYKFESITVFGAEDADGYLTSLYGDWRKLPPEDKRVTHHDYVMCDLHKSYLE